MYDLISDIIKKDTKVACKLSSDNWYVIWYLSNLRTKRPRNRQGLHRRVRKESRYYGSTQLTSSTAYSKDNSSSRAFLTSSTSSGLVTTTCHRSSSGTLKTPFLLCYANKCMMNILYEEALNTSTTLSYPSCNISFA